MMKHRGLFLALFFAWATAAHAQIEVEVVTDQALFLPGESLPIRVRIFNRSGQTLQFGKEDWLSFSVEARTGQIVEKLGDAPMGHDFELPTAKVATQTADLAPYFRIAKSGHYFITATIKLKDWDAEVSSRPKSFEVINGVKLMELPFGVPSTDRGQPETRKYILQKATYLKTLKLYLRVTDSTEETVFKVLPVGDITSFGKPAALLDKENKLHLLYEEGARTYNYSVVNPNGELTLRQTYYTTETNPRMKVDDKGDVVVLGGYRRNAVTDFPPTERELPAIPARTNSITGTNAPAPGAKPAAKSASTPAAPAEPSTGSSKVNGMTTRPPGTIK